MKRLSLDQKIYYGIAYPVITLLSLACLFPFLLIISSAFTDNQAIMIDGYRLVPKVFSLMAFRYIFAAPEQLLRAYGVTIFITAVGTVCGLTLISMTGYVLNRKDFKYRNALSFFIYFTTLFSGGLVPTYMLMVALNLRNNFLSVILSGLMSPFLIILMRSFMNSIPDALGESAKIDGAGDFRIFYSIMLPLAKPALATVGLFLALGYWNNWYSPMLYLTDQKLYPLQYYLYNILSSQQSAQQANVVLTGTESFPGESIKMAMAVVATGPILLLYPYVQRYFISGITVGAVKG